MTERAIDYGARPSVGAYMLRALYPGFLRKGPLFPPLRARWRRIRPDEGRLREFRRATGLDARGGLPLLYPQVITFPLQMVILTHPACPIPIWKVLQVRNHLLQHRPLPETSTLDVEAAVAGQRILEKGLELDVHVAARMDGETAWESVTTYYYRGRFGVPSPAAPPAAPSVDEQTEVAGWRTENGGGLRFSGLSGDYNGIHYLDAYARIFGFRGAFHHPHALVGQSLARLPAPQGSAQRLELWLKGPVYYGSEVRLTAAREAAGVAFALEAQGNGRPALLGRWSEATAGERLLAPGEPPAA